METKQITIKIPCIYPTKHGESHSRHAYMQAAHRQGGK